MNKIFCTLLTAIIATMSFAETQQGIVKTRGRMDASGNVISGERLSATTITIKNSSSYITNSKGTFSFTVPSQIFYIANVQKNGYQLCDNDVLNRGLQYSANPLIIVMETPDNTMADRLAAERKIRRTLSRQLQEKEDEIEALKEQKKINDQQYHALIQSLYNDQKKNDELIETMAERYSKIDFDELDDFQRKIALYIQNGELTRADSLLNTKGSMQERSAELDRMDAAINASAEELTRRQKAHKKSIELKAKALEDFAADCFSHYEICKLQHKNDSAAYWLELRASKDTMNIVWQTECGFFFLNYCADFDLAQTYMQRAINVINSNPGYSEEERGASLSYLADVYLQSGNYDDAINLYIESMNHFPENSLNYIYSALGLTNCYELIDENVKALECIRNAYSLYTKHNMNNSKILLRMYDQSLVSTKRTK